VKKKVDMERIVARYIFDREITAGKMIFLTGPRQVGKTTFALSWLSAAGVKGTNFSWDDPAVNQVGRVDHREIQTPNPKRVARGPHDGSKSVGAEALLSSVSCLHPHCH